MGDLDQRINPSSEGGNCDWRACLIIHWISEKPAVAVQTNAQQIDSDVANSDHNKSNHSDKSWASALPTATEAGVQICGIHQPADKSPGFLGIPAPVAPPGFIGPNLSLIHISEPTRPY